MISDPLALFSIDSELLLFKPNDLEQNAPDDFVGGVKNWAIGWYPSQILFKTIEKTHNLVRSVIPFKTEHKKFINLTLSSDRSPEKTLLTTIEEGVSPAALMKTIFLLSGLFSGEFYNDNKRIPIFLREKKAFSTEEMVQVLFSATNDDVKCTEPPKQVQMNAVFLVDLRYIPLDDLRADGLPQYDSYNGKRTLNVVVEGDNHAHGEFKVEIIHSQHNKAQRRQRFTSSSGYITVGTLTKTTSTTKETCM